MVEHRLLVLSDDGDESPYIDSATSRSRDTLPPFFPSPSSFRSGF